jgi:hypothetical protein
MRESDLSSLMRIGGFYEAPLLRSRTAESSRCGLVYLSGVVQTFLGIEMFYFLFLFYEGFSDGDRMSTNFDM